MASEKPETGAQRRPRKSSRWKSWAAGCRTLFGVSASTFAGATAGMSGDYSVAEMKDHINKWLKKEVKA